MRKLLMSIGPEHVAHILDGSKKFEFRRTLCRRKAEAILLYATAPAGLVVGEAEILGTVMGTPEEVWARTGHAAGISRAEFDRYFAGKERAGAYVLGRTTRFSRPRTLAEYGVSRPPQSFLYVEEPDRN